MLQQFWLHAAQAAKKADQLKTMAGRADLYLLNKP
jgi:hypothetical protein